jgi:hypothetical protein
MVWAAPAVKAGKTCEFDWVAVGFICNDFVPACACAVVTVIVAGEIHGDQSPTAPDSNPSEYTVVPPPAAVASRRRDGCDQDGTNTAPVRSGSSATTSYPCGLVLL